MKATDPLVNKNGILIRDKLGCKVGLQCSDCELEHALRINVVPPCIYQLWVKGAVCDLVGYLKDPIFDATYQGDDSIGRITP